MTDQANELAPPSSFVTVLGWVLIVLSGLMLLLLQLNLMLPTLLVSENLSNPLEDLPSQSLIHSLTAFMIQHMGAIALATQLISASACVCAIGLLRRRNWGRLGMTAMLGLAICYQLATSAFAWGVWQGLADNMPCGTPLDLSSPCADLPTAETPFLKEINTMKWVSGLFTLCLCGLLAWLIHKLRTSAIRAEFRPVK